VHTSLSYPEDPLPRRRAHNPNDGPRRLQRLVLALLDTLIIDRNLLDTLLANTPLKKKR
jgi:hypothetical protein